jgi:hypothetical protein
VHHVAGSSAAKTAIGTSCAGIRWIAVSLQTDQGIARVAVEGPQVRRGTLACWLRPGAMIRVD